MPSASAKQRLVVVGNGMAGLRFLEELVALASDRFAITVIGAEPHPAYNRVLLSPLLAGAIGEADVRLKARDWYELHGIELRCGSPAVGLDPTLKFVTLADGAQLDFDACVLATGSDPIRLNLPGNMLPGVMTFRALGDVAAMTERARSGCRAVVIGGGLLGIEAAYGLARAGVPVTLLHLMDRLMERQLDTEGARLLRIAIESKGIDIILGAETARFVGDQHLEAVELKDGRTLPCDLAVMAIGVSPSKALATTAGLETARGIIVDDNLQTSSPAVYALGECAQHRGTCYGLVEPAYEQARVLASLLTGRPAAYAGSLLATNLKVSGVPVFSAGDFDGRDAEPIVLSDEGAGTYRKLVVRDGVLAGVVMVGDTTDSLWYLDKIRCGEPIAHLRESLAFGRAFAEAA